jgi:hypothetical protein
MNLYDEFFAVATALKKAKIRFAVVGGIAMAVYDKPRFTRDIDILIHSKDEDKIADSMEKAGYFETAEPWIFKKVPIMLRRFVKTEKNDFMPIDILVGKDEKIDAIIARSVSRKWEKGIFKVVSKNDLIWLKKQRSSDQDKVDIRTLKNDKD